MMPTSTNVEPVGASAAATRSVVGGLTALQSTKIGLALLEISVGTRRCASATASPGGRIERMKSLAAISSSVAGVMPAALARSTVSALRPASEVSTLTPLSVSRRPTPAPIMPGAITATTGVILFSGSCPLFGAKSCGLWPPMARLFGVACHARLLPSFLVLRERRASVAASCACPLLHQQCRCTKDHQHQQQRGRPAHEPPHGADRNAGERDERKSLEHAVDHAVACIRSLAVGTLRDARGKRRDDVGAELLALSRAFTS